MLGIRVIRHKSDNTIIFSMSYNFGVNWTNLYLAILKILKVYY